MILKMKYHSDTGLLVPYQKYTLAQNNHLADIIMLTSTDPNCRNYKYCLEFVCYNSKNVPKASYISDSLEYGADGINFSVPNNLTQYRGFVDIQITGFDKINSEIVFKSISKNSKAFDVEGSLSVLENAISDTPNIITEMQGELEYFRSVEDSIIEDFITSVNKDFGKLIANYHYHIVFFRDYDKIIGHQVVLNGAKAKKPNFILPPNTIENGGWYNIATEKKWNWETDIVESDVTLIINYHTQGLVFDGVKVTGYNNNHDKIFFPTFHDDIKITSAEGKGINIGKDISFQIPFSYTNLSMIKSSKRIKEIAIDSSNKKFLSTADGAVYLRDFSELYLFPSANTSLTAVINQQCLLISEKAFAENNYLTKIVLPDIIAEIKSNAFENCALLKKLELGRNIVSVGDNIVKGCLQLNSIFVTTTTPPKVFPTSFVVSPTLPLPNIFVPETVLDAYLSDNIWCGFSPRVFGNYDYRTEISSLASTLENESIQRQNDTIALQEDKLDCSPHDIDDWNAAVQKSSFAYSSANATNNPCASYDKFCGLRIVKDSGSDLAKFELAAPLNNNKLFLRCATANGGKAGWREVGGVDDTHPVGSLFFSTNSKSPAEIFGGSWTRFAQGKTLVGVNEGESEFAAAEKIGGEKTHLLTNAEMPSHNHTFDAYNDGYLTEYGVVGLRSGRTNAMPIYKNWASSWAGKDTPHQNMQPYITVYIWRRIG